MLADSYDMMKQCWSIETAVRPTFNTLQETLLDVSTSEDLTSHISLQTIDSQSPYYQSRRHQGTSETVDDDAMRQDEGNSAASSTSVTAGTVHDTDVYENKGGK